MGNNTTVLTPNAGITNYKTEGGVTYFKLEPDIHFIGDTTKGCGLLGEEIDGNFFFLRGYDISGITINEDRDLIITRVDPRYKPLVINLGKEGQDFEMPEIPDNSNDYRFDFDDEQGILTITYPNGEVISIEGFFVEGRDVRVATDTTIKGDSTKFNPLRLSEGELTGTYSPVVEYFDITETKQMPEGRGKGYRIITKEKIDKFGKLYSFDEVQQIKEKLAAEDSDWHVPTKEEWDEMLNSFECPEDRNHSERGVNYYGKIAGIGVKSSGTLEDGNGLWKKHTPPEGEQPVYGLDLKGLNVLPVGRVIQSNNLLDTDDDADVINSTGYTRLASFWCDTVNTEGAPYVKSFSYHKGSVRQEFVDEARVSLRLVKEYNLNNFREIETIFGVPYRAVLVFGQQEDSRYCKVWLASNFADSSMGTISDQWEGTTEEDKGTEIVYFINEFTGTEWVKKAMVEGDSVVIHEYDGARLHEWRVMDGELVDTSAIFKRELQETFDELRNADAELRQDLDTEIAERTAADATLTESINTERDERTADVARIDESINEITEDITELRAKDTELEAALTAETEARINEDTSLSDRIEAERNQRALIDGVLSDRIDAEEEARINSDDLLSGKDIKAQTIVLEKNDDNFVKNNNDANVVTLQFGDTFFSFGDIISND